MIEFKAECGHTVRARDEDAGGVVRCSYCGRNAPVPDSASSELDFLFREVEQTGEPEVNRRRRRKVRPGRAARAAARRDRGGGGSTFDPFALVLKLCYAAALIIIVVVVVQKWVMPMFDEDARTSRLAGSEEQTGRRPRPDGTTQERRSRGPGLVSGAGSTGLFVASTPEGAHAFCVEQSKAPPRGRIVHVPGVRQFRTNGQCPRVSDGEYVVEVAFPWNDPNLSNPSLSDYENYLAFRRAIERASDERRRQLVEEYFIPDEANDAFIAETDDQIYIIRQYRQVEIRNGRSKGVRAMFLPRIVPRGSTNFSVEPLVMGYIPDQKNYEFDESHVRGELAYYGVAEADRLLIIAALSRIGVVPYVTPDGRTRLFKIDMHDGAFATQVIRERPE